MNWQSITDLPLSHQVWHCFYLAANSANNILIVPFFKQIALPLGVVGFGVVLPDHRRHIQHRQPHRRLGRPCDTFPVVLVAIAASPSSPMPAATHNLPNTCNYLTFASANEVVIFCTAMCGACLGFLWFNAYPAQVFMGDVGALALGAALGLPLPSSSAKSLSSSLWAVVVVSRIRYASGLAGIRKPKRIFLMAPIHHHYEQKAGKETQVVVRFWIITIVLVLIGLSTLKIR